MGSEAINRRNRYNAIRLIELRCDLLVRLLRVNGRVNVDAVYGRQDRQVRLRQFTPTPDAATVLDIMMPALDHWGWRVADVWSCYDAPHAYNRFVQVRIDIHAPCMVDCQR
jgi:CheY-like chemotaxis protein